MQLLIMKQTVKNHSKGDVVEIRATSTPFGGKEPDYFVMVEVPDAFIADYKQYNDKWRLLVDWEVVNQNTAIDGYRIRLFATNTNTSGTAGNLTRENVEQFINSWNGTVHSFGTNEVVFDITIFDAIKSYQFWEREGSAIADLEWTETNYDEATGVHGIRVDYSSLQRNPTAIEALLVDKGATIISHQDRVVEFELERAVVRQAFIDFIKRKTRRINVARRRYYFTEAVVDYIIGQGGTLTTDIATVNSYIKDKLDD